MQKYQTLSIHQQTEQGNEIKKKTNTQIESSKTIYFESQNIISSSLKKQWLQEQPNNNKLFFLQFPFSFGTHAIYHFQAHFKNTTNTANKTQIPEMKI